MDSSCCVGNFSINEYNVRRFIFLNVTARRDEESNATNISFESNVNIHRLILAIDIGMKIVRHQDVLLLSTDGCLKDNLE
jgi:hypothetical protein